MKFLKHKELIKNINRLKNKYNKNGEIILVEVETYLSSIKNECFNNVNTYIKSNGGECIHGWQIHDTGNFLEGIAHAIYKSPEGKHICVSPQDCNSFYLIIDQNIQAKRIVPLRYSYVDSKKIDNFIVLLNYLNKANIISSDILNQYNIYDNHQLILKDNKVFKNNIELNIPNLYEALSIVQRLDTYISEFKQNIRIYGNELCCNGEYLKCCYNMDIQTLVQLQKEFKIFKN